MALMDMIFATKIMRPELAGAGGMGAGLTSTRATGKMWKPMVLREKRKEKVRLGPKAHGKRERKEKKKKISQLSSPLQPMRSAQKRGKKWAAGQKATERRLYSAGTLTRITMAGSLVADSSLQLPPADRETLCQTTVGVRLLGEVGEAGAVAEEGLPAATTKAVEGTEVGVEVPLPPSPPTEKREGTLTG